MQPNTKLGSVCSVCSVCCYFHDFVTNTWISPRYIFYMKWLWMRISCLDVQMTGWSYCRLFEWKTKHSGVKSPSVGFLVKWTNCHLLAVKSEKTLSCFHWGLCPSDMEQTAAVDRHWYLDISEYWMHFGWIELHRAVKLSEACQCAISLIDSAIPTLLCCSGSMQTLAIWLLCPFNVIAGMLSG